MTLMATKRSGGDKLVVKTEEVKRRKTQEAAASSSESTSDSEDDSLSETTDTDEELEANMTALKPIAAHGVDINAKPKSDETTKVKVCILGYIYSLI